MATPTRSHATSTPKPHLSTPSKLMASPRPGTSGNSSRPLAYKSPAVKTPASIHGHHPSISSQPSSTPLGGNAVHDEILALTSPAAALINSIGTTGLTPLGNSADGLGITTSISGVPTRGTAGPVNPEVERLHRAQHVVNTLRGRVGGHGITRDGVERIAQLQGFTTLWDDDNLTIAGNCVDLEVNFSADGRDDVRDVSLKLNIAENVNESEEPQFQEQGTHVIKDNLQSLATTETLAPWKSIESFASNLQYLSQLDRIETGSPCFNAMGDLYHTFQQIWNAEKTKLQGRSAWQHLRQSAVGRPIMDRKPKLGLALDYWSTGPESKQKESSTMEEAVESASALYAAHVACEQGLPVTAMAKKWLSSHVLLEQPENASEPNDLPKLPKPDWQDPVQDSVNLLTQADADATMMEKSTDKPASVLNLHFYCALTPEVYLPLNVAASMNVEIPMVTIDQESTLTYQAALHRHAYLKPADDTTNEAADRWLRSLPVAEKRDVAGLREHSYALYSPQNGPALWCYPVNHLNFTHPKHVVAVLPTLRQYIVLWRLLQSLVAYTGIGSDSSSYKTTSKQPTPAVQTRPLKRSNRKALPTTIHGFLNRTDAAGIKAPLPIDLTLDVLSDIAKAKLDIYVPLIGTGLRSTKNTFIFLSFNVCQNGILEVRDLRGLPQVLLDTINVKSKLIRILEVTEDIGLMVEWLLGQIRDKS